MAAPRDKDDIDKAVEHQQSMNFWVGPRQPHWKEGYVHRWGEWLDDKLTDAEYGDD